MDVNSVRIQGTSSETHFPGHALYPVTAILSHSCIANTKTVLKTDFTNECIATVFIPKGEEITKSYVSPLETTSMRRRKLKAGWYFECTCSRCNDPVFYFFI